MRDAAAQGARLIQFPEGALSGYAKNPILSWDEVDWAHVRDELESVMRLAKQLQLWVVLGSAHSLTPPHWPHNSLYVISAEGRLVTRYDKRICSHTEKSRFYAPGTEAIRFEVDGFTFGCLICIEINHPTLFIEYAGLGVDCLLLSAYPVDGIFQWTPDPRIGRPSRGPKHQKSENVGIFQRLHAHHHGETAGHSHGPAHRAPFWVRHYDTITQLVTLGGARTMHAQTLSLVPIAPGDTVLDVGCGTGALLEAIEPSLGPAGRDIESGAHPNPQLSYALGRV